MHANVLFEGNLIQGTDGAGIFAAGVEGLTVRGNTITGACRAPRNEIGQHAVYIMSSANVVTEGNVIDPAVQGEGFRGAVRLPE